jgi:ankyrin repeat protein
MEAEFAIAPEELCQAVVSGDLTRAGKVLDEGPPGLAAAHHGDGWPLLHLAPTPEMADLLLERGADLGARNRHPRFGRRNTPLHAAVYSNRPPVVRRLIERGAELDAVDAPGLTPLHLAAANGWLECARILLDAGADAHVRSLRESGTGFDDKTALDLCLWRDRTHDDGSPLDPAAMDATAELLREFGAGGESEVLRATYAADRDRVQRLLAEGARPNPFEAAALGDAARVLRAIDRHPSLLRAYSADGWTLLHLAAFFGHLGLVRTLLERGASPRARSRPHAGSPQNTPLHAAAAARRDEIGRLLLAQGSEVDARDGAGWTPLRIAAGNGLDALIEALLAAGADPVAERDGTSAAELAEQRGHPAAAERLRRAAAVR